MFFQKDRQVSIARELAMRLSEVSDLNSDSLKQCLRIPILGTGAQAVPHLVAHLQQGGLPFLARAFSIVDSGEQRLKDGKRFPNQTKNPLLRVYSDELQFRTNRLALSDLQEVITVNPILLTPRRKTTEITTEGLIHHNFLNTTVSLYDGLIEIARGKQHPDFDKAMSQARELVTHGIRTTPYIRSVLRGNLPDGMRI